MQARPISTQNTASLTQAAAKTGAYVTVGRIDKVDASGITFSHQPVPALQWPAMTMTFRLANPKLARGYKVGDRVRFSFDQLPSGPMVRTMAREAGQ